MSDVTVIGLGAMGSALVQALLNAGHTVTAWNRTPKMMSAVEALGARCVSDCAEAIRSSPVVMVCVSDYNAFSGILEQSGVSQIMDGRVIINLSTGTPDEVRAADERVTKSDAAYLDGAILVYPATVGNPAAQILVAGPDEAYHKCERLLQSLGGDLRYLGSNIAAAAALDLAFLSRLMATVCGTIHGVLICETEGVSVDQFATLFPAGDRGRTVAQAISDDNFDVGVLGATAAVSRGALTRLHDQAESAGINSEIPDLLLDLLNRAINAGYGEEETAALIKVLRESGKF